jgi:excisionase family DNA binding protein
MAPQTTVRSIGSRRWLTPADAVAYLGLPSIRALYQRVRRGQVRAHKFGRHLRFLVEELDEACSAEPIG